MQINTLNRFMVGSKVDSKGNNREIMVGLPHLLMEPVAPNDALVLAAYLVLLSEHKADHTFAEVLEAVTNA